MRPQTWEEFTDQSLGVIRVDMLTDPYGSFIRLFNFMIGSEHRDKVAKVKKQFSARTNEGWSVKQMLIATYGCSKSNFHMGKDPNNDKRYLTPEFILRDYNLDKWYEIGKTYIRREELKIQEQIEKEEKERKEMEHQKWVDEMHAKGLKTPLDIAREKLAARFNLKTHI